MSDPWLTIIGLGADGHAGLSDASRKAVSDAEIIFGAPRHLALVGAGDRGRDWPVPFKIDPVMAQKGRKVVVLASGDPFWYGAGGSLMRQLERGEWASYPAPSTFSWAASRLGWRLEETLCIGLHAAPFERLTPLLSRGVKVICLIRDGAAVGALAEWLTARGFGASTLHVMETLGGPEERLRQSPAEGFALGGITHPVAVGIDCQGAKGLPRASGLPDEAFAHDGQITKRPIRAMTLSALAPRPGELLWDLGAGSGSVSVEWCLSAPGTRAIALEARADRAANITTNAAGFGLAHRMSVTVAAAPDGLADLPAPDAVFIGGGANQALLETVWKLLPDGARLVANAVTIESEALFAAWHAQQGGSLLRLEIATATPLGRMRGWQASRPVIQWSVVK
ncbi:MAG: precorrin-6y C5,15-methyltransferase (decarboxylating) subunit CbiE [Albidovulum sp.]